MSERDMQTLLDLIERVLGREWIADMEWLRTLPDNSVAAIEARLLAGDFAGLVVEVEAAARTFAAATHAALERAARAEAIWLDKQPSLREAIIRFDATDGHAIRAAEINELKNVQGLVAETRANIRAVIVDGQRAGTNPRQMAREIRSSIGLTEQQSQWVRSYEADLRAGRYARAMRRELRDERSDRMLTRLRREGGELTDAQIESLTERYRKAQLRYRAEMIGRTESARNVHAGSQEAFRQAIERGDLQAEDIEAEWHPGPVTRHARKDHRSSFLLEQRPKWGEPFRMPSGARMRYPGDGELGAGAEDIVHCRCTRSLTLA